MRSIDFKSCLKSLSFVLDFSISIASRKSTWFPLEKAHVCHVIWTLQRREKIQNKAGKGSIPFPAFIRNRINGLASIKNEMWNATRHTLNGLTSALKSMIICIRVLLDTNTSESPTIYRHLETTILRIHHSSANRLALLRLSPGIPCSQLCPSFSIGYAPCVAYTQIDSHGHLKRASSPNRHTNRGRLTLAIPLDRLLRYHEKLHSSKGQKASQLVSKSRWGSR